MWLDYIDFAKHFMLVILYHKVKFRFRRRYFNCHIILFDCESWISSLSNVFFKFESSSFFETCKTATGNDVNVSLSASLKILLKLAWYISKKNINMGVTKGSYRFFWYTYYIYFRIVSDWSQIRFENWFCEWAFGKRLFKMLLFKSHENYRNPESIIDR